MFTPRHGILCLLLLVFGCGNAPTGNRAVQIDTLFGFKLGSLYPEVLEEARKREVLLTCEEAGAQEMVFCRHPMFSVSPLDFGPYGPYTLGFEDGRLVLIQLELRDWFGVPVDTLLGRLAAFGRPTDTTGEGDYYVWTRGDITRTLSCNQPKSAADCNLWLERTDEE
jgi:hypothetical protein